MSDLYSLKKMLSHVAATKSLTGANQSQATQINNKKTHSKL